eukprot:scaffold771_cov387-Prasinococcus_capsulatus_cf.AAC.28
MESPQLPLRRSVSNEQLLSAAGGGGRSENPPGIHKRATNVSGGASGNGNGNTGNEHRNNQLCVPDTTKPLGPDCSVEVPGEEVEDVDGNFPAWPGTLVASVGLASVLRSQLRITPLCLERRTRLLDVHRLHRPGQFRERPGSRCKLWIQAYLGATLVYSGRFCLPDACGQVGPGDSTAPCASMPT